jgi:hypothetical protein
MAEKTAEEKLLALKASLHQDIASNQRQIINNINQRAVKINALLQDSR